MNVILRFFQNETFILFEIQIYMFTFMFTKHACITLHTRLCKYTTAIYMQVHGSWQYMSTLHLLGTANLDDSYNIITRPP